MNLSLAEQKASLDDRGHRLHLIQLAGGKGLRVGGDTPKQYRETGQGLLLGISLREFLGLSPEVGKVVSVTVAAAEGWHEIIQQTMAFQKLKITLAKPGATRTQSTWHALQSIAEHQSPRATDLVAVHDAARPFATACLLAELVQVAGQAGAAVPGIAVADTILQVNDESSAGQYLQRDSLVAVQTPQVFRWDLLYAAHRWADENQQVFTDDGSLVAARNTDPLVVEGEVANWKVTTEDDWQRAADLLK